MKLPFGIFEGKYIHISEIKSGRTDVLCPYCNVPLIAKKGRIKRHHFAHDGVGCVANFASHFFSLSGRLPTQLALSIYANQKITKIQSFLTNLQEEQRAFQNRETDEITILPNLNNSLAQLAIEDKTGAAKEVASQVDRYISQTIAPFPEFHLIRSEQLSLIYTDGKRECVFAQLDPDKHEYFYAKTFEPAVKFLKKYHQKAYGFKEINTKLNLFQKDLTYFNQFDLYFIEVVADHHQFYKIGLTSRKLEVRLKEIELDLKKYYLNIQLKPLFQIKGFAFLETFFKRKYEAHQKKIGQLTEYFTFSKREVELILKDLQLLQFENGPDRKQVAWIDWVYFNFNGKIYGHSQKSVYIKKEKIVLTSREVEQLSILMENEEKK